MKYNINFCGDDIPDTMGHHVNIIREHTNQEIVIEIGSDMPEECKASWGMDDL